MWNFLNVIGNAANTLVALAAGAEQSVHAIEAANPLVATAVNAAVAEAQANGVPVGAVAELGSAALAVARAIAAQAASGGAATAPAG